MPTKLTVSQTFDATPQQVFQLFGDPDFLAARLVANKGLDPEIVTQESDDTSATLVTRQGIPAEALPSSVANFIQGDPSTQRTENWTADGEGGYRADWSVTIKGAPATLKGVMLLTAEGDGSVLAITGTATVPIPLFGGKIEKVIVEQVSELLQREEKFTQQRLVR